MLFPEAASLARARQTKFFYEVTKELNRGEVARDRQQKTTWLVTSSNLRLLDSKAVCAQDSRLGIDYSIDDSPVEVLN